MSAAPPAPAANPASASAPAGPLRTRRSDAAEAIAWRLRLGAVVVALGAMVFRQAPGLIVSDTKLDLTLNPGGFLARALSLWDDDAFGQLQNQAYGYLFPVGPLHWALGSLGVPGWVTQRIWWWIVLSTAFLGMWRLSGALRIAGPWPRLLAAVLYALTPRMLGEVAVTSVEVWPAAVAPWIVAPLLDRGERTWRWRILRSALAAACLGGVNAVASAAALIPSALWWLTRVPTRHTVRMFLAWSGAVLAAIGWWFGPLLVLGRYSPPFLSWIEDARITTGTASPFTAFQGMTAWLGYLTGSTGPSWPGAWRFASVPLLIVLSGAVSALGLAGLLGPRLPERRWLLVLTVTGLLLLTMAWAGPGSGPLAAAMRTLLDGPLAPLRNIHKFELVLRIPMLLGLAAACSRLARVRPPDLLRQLPRPLVGLVTGLLVVAVIGPGVAATITRPGAYEDIPDYWRTAAAWLDEQPTPGSVLVVPAAPFAEFSWGSTRDEPFQALLRRPLAVRDAVPLGSAGATRMLDELGRALASGRADAGFMRTLAGAGVGYVLVRNDLVYGVGGAEPLALHEALASAGLTRSAAFGPPAGSPIETPEQTLNDHTLLPYPSIEVYAVQGTATARLTPAEEVSPALAGAEDTTALSAGGLPTTVVAPSALPGAPVILTDGNRRRELAFGNGNGGTSQVLEADDPGRAERRTIDVIDPQAPQTTLSWGGGIRTVRASSSASDTTATLRLGSGASPLAALDGDPTTSWVSGSYAAAVGQWLDVEFDQPRDVSGSRLTTGSRLPGSAPATVVSVTTDAGTSRSTLGPRGIPTELAVPPGATRHLRIRLEETGPGTALAFDIAELELPGVTPRPWLVLPDPGDRDIAAMLLRVQSPGTAGCRYAGDRPLCSRRLASDPEEAGGIFRLVTTGRDGRFGWSGTATPRPGAALEAMLDLPGRVTVTASSRAVAGAAARPATIFDNDPGTGWVAAQDDKDPTLTITLPAPRTISGMQLQVDQYLAGARARTVRVQAPGLDETVTVDDQGYARFPATTTTTLTVTLRDPQPITSIDALSGLATRLPAGLSELVLLGAEDLRTRLDPASPVRTACGFGPELRVDGISVLTEVVGTADDVLRERPLTWRACADPGRAATTELGIIALAGGRHTVEAPASAQFRPQSLVLESVARSPAAVSVQPTLRADGGWELPARATNELLVLPHNANIGFAARDAAGTPLRPVTVSGWQQGWWVPAGGATVVTETFTPQALYAVLLIVGGLALLGLLVVAVWSARAAGAAQPAGLRALAASGPRSQRGWAGAALVATLGWFGLTGALAIAYAVLAGRLGRGRPMLETACSTMAPVAVAVVLVAASPWTQGGAQLTSAVVQWGVLAGIASVVIAALAVGLADSERRPQRMIGRSTKR